MVVSRTCLGMHWILWSGKWGSEGGSKGEEVERNLGVVMVEDSIVGMENEEVWEGAEPYLMKKKKMLCVCVFVLRYFCFSFVSLFLLLDLYWCHYLKFTILAWFNLSLSSMGPMLKFIFNWIILDIFLPSKHWSFYLSNFTWIQL